MHLVEGKIEMDNKAEIISGEKKLYRSPSLQNLYTAYILADTPPLIQFKQIHWLFNSFFWKPIACISAPSLFYNEDLKIVFSIIENS